LTKNVLHGFDQIDVSSENLVDQLANFNPFGLGLFAQISENLFVEIDRSIELGITPVELASFPFGEIIFTLHRLALNPILPAW